MVRQAFQQCTQPMDPLSKEFPGLLLLSLNHYSFHVPAKPESRAFLISPYDVVKAETCSGKSFYDKTYIINLF